MVDAEARRKEFEARREEFIAKLESGEYKRPREPVIEPPINASIWPTEDGKWVMGNLMLYSKGIAYCLRPRKDKKPAPIYDSANGPLIPRHFTSAIFEIGTDVLVKVKWAPEGWPRTEGEAMRLVRDKAPEVPVPEVMHFWHDAEWTRYFLIVRRVHGDVLDRVWFTLTDCDKKQVANEVATHIQRIAAITAPRFQCPNGEPLGEARIVVSNEHPRGMWEPVPGGWPGPFTPDEFREHLKEVSDGLEPPEFGSQFHLYHGDPTPENIIVTGAEIPKAADSENVSHVHVAGIIDWEKAGFYPDFWALLYPTLSVSGFELSLTMEQMIEDMQQTAQYRDALFRVLVLLDADTVESYNAAQTWWAIFDAARMRFVVRRAQDRLKAADGLRVE